MVSQMNKLHINRHRHHTPSQNVLPYKTYVKQQVLFLVCSRLSEFSGCREALTPCALPSSKTPLWIFETTSLAASRKASTTLSPDLALASMNKSPSSFAHNSAVSRSTSLCLRRDDVEVETPASGSQRSTLLPTRMQVRFGSAYCRTSANHVRAFAKLACEVTS